MSVVWLQSLERNVYSALYPTNNGNGLIPVGYAIEKNGEWLAVSFKNPQNISNPYRNKQEAERYILEDYGL